jgi:hypothetical protein
MITEPTTDGQRNALQDVETLYIGVATPAVRRDLIGTVRAESRLCAIELELNDHDGSYRLGVGSNEQRG